MNPTIIKAGEITDTEPGLKAFAEALAKKAQESGKAVIVPTVEKMLRYADQLGMSVTSTYYSDEFASVKGIKDGREITILQYREGKKDA